MSVEIDRTLLQLAPLEINDFENYYVGPDFFGAQVSWTRQVVMGAWTDGGVETNATRGMVNEQVQIEVLADSGPDLRYNIDTLTTALLQGTYTITLLIDEVPYIYSCNRADYKRTWSGPRLIEHQVQMDFTIPRQPVPLVGVV